MIAKEKLYLYPLWLRVWHGVNALGIITLIVTGISMQYSTPRFTVVRFDVAVSLHNIAGITVSAFYLLFIAGNLVSGNKKFYRIKRKGFGEQMKKQARYYLFGMFKGESGPFPVSEKRKFNPLQKSAYVVVMYAFVPVIVVTGIALLFPELIIDKVYGLSGVMLTAVFHGIAGFFVFIFLLVHLYVASIGKSPKDNFKAIITGWHPKA